MHVGPSGASVVPVTAPPVIDWASEAVTSWHGLIGRTPALLGSSFDEDGVDCARCTWWPRVTRSGACDALDDLLADADPDPVAVAVAVGVGVAARLESDRAPFLSTLT